MASILEDVQTSAEWISKALSSSGYKADFSPDSLIEIDRFFREHVRNGKATPDGLLAKSPGSRLFSIGCYVGEVIRRRIGGEWQANDSDPRAEINLALRMADGAVYWPVQRVMKRFKLGEEEGIAAYGSAAGLQFTRSIWAAADSQPSTETTRPPGS